MADQLVQWLIRNKDGRVDGPFTTAEVIKQIRSGVYLGEEFISKYPSGRWNPISYDQSFFDVLLEVLEGELDTRPKKPLEEDTVESFVNIEKDDTIQKDKKRKKSDAVPELLDSQTPLIIDVDVTKKHSKQGKAINPAEELKEKRQGKKPKPKPKKKVSKRTQRAKLQWIIFAAVCVIISFIIFSEDPNKDAGKRLHLRAPRAKVKRTIT
ncbi:MAG: hypothetical protein HRT44_05290, partial [Bdellovibrionales bacterium]|nr:hypothetical protein [Bdellovibrionales bacterium]NQZ18656.1 hypothetical protein [Bdellovibrionales bacterium]